MSQHISLDAPTLLISCTVFDDRTHIVYSGYFPDREFADRFSPLQQCEASPQAWGYLLHTLPESGWLGHAFDVRVSVIDRRPGTRATSRGCGHSLTSR